MIAKKREAILPLALVGCFVACTVQSREAPAPAVPAPAPPPATTPPPPAAPTPPAATVATATPPSSETKAPTPLVPAVRKPPARAKNERECKACNGAWGKHGLSQNPACNCRTSDAGKRCRDGTECEAGCIASEAPEREVTEQGPPPKGFWVGKCSEFVTTFGCFRAIEDGAGSKAIELSEPPSMICVD